MIVPFTLGELHDNAPGHHCQPCGCGSGPMLPAAAVMLPEAAAGPAAVTFEGLEVTQAIQDMQHTVPLIADKTTVVRVYSASVPPSRGHGEEGGEGWRQPWHRPLVRPVRLPVHWCDRDASPRAFGAIHTRLRERVLQKLPT